MSAIYSKFKEVTEWYNSMKLVLDDKYITKKLPRFLCIIATSMLLFVYLDQHCDIIGNTNLGFSPIFNDNVRSYINKMMFPFVVSWGVYHFVDYPLLLRAVIHIDTIKNSTYIRYYQTADDIIEILASAMLFVYALDELMRLSNYEKPPINCNFLFFFAFFYLSILFINWVFQKNNYNPYTMSTGYCDKNNSIIREGCLVCYYNKLYWIEDASKYILRRQAKAEKDSYVLRTTNLSSNYTIALEEAAKDTDGNLTVINSYSIK